MNGTGNRSDERPRGHRPYPHEMLTAGYLAVTGALGALLGHPAKIWPNVLSHAIGIIVILFVVPRLPQRRWVVVLRDWGLVFVLPFLYVEVAHLNRLLSSGYHDRAIQSVERHSDVFQCDRCSNLHGQIVNALGRAAGP